MILAVSRFRVANGKEGEVRAAFEARPRRVEQAAGFLGLEVFTDTGDPATFWLVTRWADEPRFRAWHRSAEHKASHALIPKGLKLDPSHTLIVTLQRLDGVTSGGEAAERVLDHAPAVGRFLARSLGVGWLQLDPEGVVLSCHPSLAELLRDGQGEILGRPLWPRLAGASAELLQAQMAAPSGERLLLHLLDGRGAPFSVSAELSPMAEGWMLLTEPPWQQHAALERQLVELNEDLAAATRASARQAAELQQSRKQLEENHWFIERSGDVLPLCMTCQKVDGGRGWETLADFLKRRSLFLSHGYCPPCAAELLGGDDGRE